MTALNSNMNNMIPMRRAFHRAVAVLGYPRMKGVNASQRPVRASIPLIVLTSFIRTFLPF
jgi:hypothetical protein